MHRGAGAARGQQASVVPDRGLAAGLLDLDEPVEGPGIDVRSARADLLDHPDGLDGVLVAAERVLDRGHRGGERPGRLADGGRGRLRGVPGPLAELAHLVQVLVPGGPGCGQGQRHRQPDAGVRLLQQWPQGHVGRRGRAGPERRGVQHERQRLEQGVVLPLRHRREQPRPPERVLAGQVLAHHQDRRLGVDGGEVGQHHLAVTHRREDLPQHAEAHPHGLGAPAFEQRLEGADDAAQPPGDDPHLVHRVRRVGPDPGPSLTRAST